MACLKAAPHDRPCCLLAAVRICIPVGHAFARFLRGSAAWPSGQRHWTARATGHGGLTWQHCRCDCELEHGAVFSAFQGPIMVSHKGCHKRPRLSPVRPLWYLVAVAIVGANYRWSADACGGDHAGVHRAVFDLRRCRQGAALRDNRVGLAILASVMRGVAPNPCCRP